MPRPGRTLSGAGGVERGPGHRQAGQYVVAVHPHAGEAEAAGALEQRDPDCFSIGSEIAHWLFWQKNTTGALNTLAQTNASLTSP
jgi:hypothetical protein